MSAHATGAPAPLAGIKVAEFTHMVMGPAVGHILAGLGAEVIRIEPIGGDRTRTLLGSGSGYFPMYNRGKKSICLDLKSPEGLAVARDLAKSADVLVENFRPGALDRLGLSYETLAQINPRLIYCSEKGFLPGPYEQRTALDEVAQMMGGLAYMTGPPGRPLRAGSSVVDVTGGMFGVIGILAALEERHRDRARTKGRRKPVRDDGLPCRPAHGAAGCYRKGCRAHARAHLCLGDLRRIRDRRRTQSSSASSAMCCGRSSAPCSVSTRSGLTKACALTISAYWSATAFCHRCAPC